MYNATEPVPDPYNYGQILMKRVRVQSFIVTDYVNRIRSAISAMREWMKSGQIKYAEDIVEGLENAPKAVLKLFDGSNTGKLIVKVSPEPR